MLEEHGRRYGKLHLTIAFTIGLQAPLEFKTCKNWKNVLALSDENFGAALLRGRGEHHNPAVCLKASGLVGIDVDGMAGRELAMQLAPEKWPRTVAVRSGRPDAGLHMWYAANKKTRKHKIQISSSLALSEDGYLICPPALHTTAGKHYEFLPGQAPWEHRITPFPDWLQDRLTSERRERDVEARADDRSPIPEGERHAHMLRIAGAMRRAGAGEPEIASALLTLNARRCIPPKPEHVIRALARDVTLRYQPEPDTLDGLVTKLDDLLH